MQAISESIGLLWEALFLQPQPYAAMRDRQNPAGKGVVILVILGLLLALAAFIGALLTWASSPDLAAVQEVVTKNLQQMEWWAALAKEPEALAVWQQVWESIWQFIGFMTPTPLSGLAGFIFTPLSLIISWIIFGLVAHVIARIFGGQGRLGQTLGATSLAAAPQLLGVFSVLPFVTLAGIGVWTLLTRYMAIRVTHDLSWGRSVWVIVLTTVVLFVLVFVLVSAGAFAFATTIAATFGGG